MVGVCTLCTEATEKAKAATQAAIGACTHEWRPFTDPGMLGVACDFGGENHTAVPTVDTVVQICDMCSAVLCSGCFTG